MDTGSWVTTTTKKCDPCRQGHDGAHASRNGEAQNRVEHLLGYFEMIELDEPVAREAISLRQQHRLRLPGAIIWAAARLGNSLLVTRDSRDFPIGDPGIR